MKKNLLKKRLVAVAAMICMMSAQSLADDFNCVWVKALTFPDTSQCKVYISYDLTDFDENMFDYTSEFKRTNNALPSTAFILTEPAQGWMFAGVARDMDLNGLYDAEKDRQIHVWHNFYFTCFYDHTNFHGQSSSQAQELAEEALAEMVKPTDQVIAVFTKGAVATRAEDEEAFGYVYSSKLYNKPGDVVTFYAYGDVDSRKTPNKYYRFDCWLNEKGDTVSRDREFTITVKGMERYYAHFEKITAKEYEENEKPLIPDRYKWDYGNVDWNPSQWSGIEEMKAAMGAADATLYDLQGRRVEKADKGLFILRGKKVVVK